MFGILKPCRHTLGPEVHRQWMAHLCGCCLGLRAAAGQPARATTNVDAVALSILVEAQRRTPTETRRAGPCPLRGGKTATVVAASDAAAGHATAVSLTMASIGLADRVADHDGLIYRIPRAPRTLAARWGLLGERVAGGLDVAAIRRWTDEANRREAVPGRSFDFYLEPTEEAAAIVCAHTATLAGRPENAAALADLGRAFGRIVHLLDAVEDAEDDIAKGRCNPLVAQEPTDPVARRRLAVTLLSDARRRASAAFDALHLEHPELARVLFVDELRRACKRTLHGGSRACAHGHTHDHGHAHAVELGDVVDGRAALARSSGFRELAGVTAASAVLLGAGANVFRPEHHAMSAMPAQPAQDPNQKERWWEKCDCCDCSCCCDCDCCCCCGDGCDCDCCGCDC